MDKVKMNLETIDGNAFNLLGAFSANAKQQGWTQEAIDAVIQEATATDYDHLLKTLIDHTECPDDPRGDDEQLAVNTAAANPRA